MKHQLDHGIEFELTLCFEDMSLDGLFPQPIHRDRQHLSDESKAMADLLRSVSSDQTPQTSTRNLISFTLIAKSFPVSNVPQRCHPV
jgi:hypothetical protein